MTMADCAAWNCRCIPTAAGASISPSRVLWRALFHCDNAYLIPALDATGYVCKTHKTSQTAFRGFGGPQGMLVIEDILDRVARTLDRAPDVVRERNFYREGDVTHYGQQVKDAGRIALIWERTEGDQPFRRSTAGNRAAFNARTRTRNAASPSRR